MKCIGPKAGDADLWMKMWGELNASTLTAQRDKKKMSHFQKYVTDCNDKADE